MNLEFKDELKRDAIDLLFSIQGDDMERDIYTESASIKWSIRINVQEWGLDKFKYRLVDLLMPIQIDTVVPDKGVEKTTVYAQVQFAEKKGSYICRIYEDVLSEGSGKWEEEEYSSFPINVSVEDKAESDEGDRSQIFVKYIMLDLTSTEKSLILTI
jgi:hypothetical protein